MTVIAEGQALSHRCAVSALGPHRPSIMAGAHGRGFGEDENRADFCPLISASLGNATSVRTGVSSCRGEVHETLGKMVGAGARLWSRVGVRGGPVCIYGHNSISVSTRMRPCVSHGM